MFVLFYPQIRIIYAGAYSIEVGIRGGNMVTIRDGAYSKFDRSTVVDEFAPALGLKVYNILFIYILFYYNYFNIAIYGYDFFFQTFLSRYVDDNISARLLAEDDNPPSPMSPMPPGNMKLTRSVIQ